MQKEWTELQNSTETPPFVAAHLQKFNERLPVKMEEFKQTFLPGGPGSDEPVLCLVELNVVNLLDVAALFNTKVKFLSQYGLKLSRFQRFFDQVILSLEGARFIEQGMPWAASGAKVIGENARFIP